MSHSKFESPCKCSYSYSSIISSSFVKSGGFFANALPNPCCIGSNIEESFDFFFSPSTAALCLASSLYKLVIIVFSYIDSVYLSAILMVFYASLNYPRSICVSIFLLHALKLAESTALGGITIKSTIAIALCSFPCLIRHIAILLSMGPLRSLLMLSLSSAFCFSANPAIPQQALRYQSMASSYLPSLYMVFPLSFSSLTQSNLASQAFSESLWRVFLSSSGIAVVRTSYLVSSASFMMLSFVKRSSTTKSSRFARLVESDAACALCSSQ
ncbi:hypothetical protein FGO68_gene17293 [Halteria grandinella]|uniref:Uncharacterized protein n=1 Tax=Halteria grandinella TaxID=5974 RepID=A0A8J8NYH6_HALGN|nr:hypothetical protein FGO68_gene17293 [Halteria grandinella]